MEPCDGFLVYRVKRVKASDRLLIGKSDPGLIESISRATRVGPSEGVAKRLTPRSCGRHIHHALLIDEPELDYIAHALG